MHVRAKTSLYLMGLLCLSTSAWADGAPLSDQLRTRLVDDGKIATLCRASIKYKYDMVDTVDANGSARKVPRCVANYEAMRAAAESYLEREALAKKEILNAIMECKNNPEQASCLKAGGNLATHAANLHEGLSENAQSAIELLAGNAGTR